MRQICDWCRLLWTYKDSTNQILLESQIRRAGIMSEWKAFATFAVEYLGMPSDSMPLYSADKKWPRKAEHILDFVIEFGNFGHNRVLKRSNYYLIGKVQALFFKLHVFIRHASIFPLDSLMFFSHYFIDGYKIAIENKISKKV